MAELPPIPWETKNKTERSLNMKRAGMVIDLRRCTGCHACSVSCKTEHDVPLGDFRNRVRYLEQPEENMLSFLPLMCMHCQDAPCLDACPTTAISRMSDGHVVINQDKCNGNKACITACPYGAIYIESNTGKADKCDMCTHRTSLDMDPACVTSCPTDALRFGDLDNPQDPVSVYAKENNAKAFKEEAGTNPNVLYVAHEKWMEDSAATGIQLSPNDNEIIYEQKNVK
jgi:tetrathionate reductase subunit B